MGVPPTLNPMSLFGVDRFHGTELSEMVASARHAVALDELRRDFEPTGWTNLDILNARHPRELPEQPPWYQEQHFAGDHGGVGGGGPITDLSAIALRWILAGAEEVGLSFDPGVMAALEAEMNPAGPIYNTPVPKGGAVSALMRRMGRPRPGPRALSEVHLSALERWAMEAKQDGGFVSYRPASLARIEAELQAWKDSRGA
ncbi:MAG: DUF2235 domain-containing protein, partial [Pseudomonadota bacterium]